MFALGNWGTSRPADVDDCSYWGMWSDYVEVDGCSSVEGLEGQHHRLESDVGRNRKPVEVTEEEGHMGEFGKIVNEVCCILLYTLQQFSRRGWESSQEGVAVVQVGDD